MNRNEQLARQMRQILNDIFRYFHTSSAPEKDALTVAKILESILACPSKEEISNSLNLLPADKECLLLPGLRLRDQENDRKRGILFQNLQKKTLWDFEPLKGETLAQTFEKHLEKQKKEPRKLADLYKQRNEMLKILIFENTGYSTVAQKRIIEYWRRLYFKASLHSIDLPKLKKFRPPAIRGRRQDAEAIDICKASKIILYFSEAFLSKPYEIKYGAAACFLWLLLRLTFQDNTNVYAIGNLLMLRISDLVVTSDVLRIDNSDIPTSNGLKTLLKILICNRSKNDPVFFNITSDWLQDQFANASQLFLESSPHPISPSAFLIFPHLHLGYTIPQTLLRNRRQGLILSEQHYYKNLLRSVKLPVYHYKP